MNRRSLLKLIGLGVVSPTLDLDKLLWIPGEKTIFLPALHRLTESEIIALEIERILPSLTRLFDREDTFYRAIWDKKGEKISARSMNVPLITDYRRVK